MASSDTPESAKARCGLNTTKVTGISEWPRTLKSVKDVRKTLGVLEYQRPFIPGFARIARPITELTKKGTPFEWTEERRQALEELIRLVTDTPTLSYPDLEHPFELEVDASAFAIGAILFQSVQVLPLLALLVLRPRAPRSILSFSYPCEFSPNVGLGLMDCDDSL